MGEVAEYSKRRKVVYDNYCGTFYKESLEEALKRACDTQRRFFENNNRSEAVRLCLLHKQIESTRHLYLMKKQREYKDHEKQLKVNLAYLHVLHNLALDRQRAKFSSNLGHYGPGTTRINLQSRIDREITGNTKSARRRGETVQILASLPVVVECDRKLPTLELLKPRAHLRPPETPGPGLTRNPWYTNKSRGRGSMKSAAVANFARVRGPHRDRTSVRSQSCHGALLPEEQHLTP